MEPGIKKVLVTGSRGFIGRNLVARLRRIKDLDIMTFDRGDAVENLDASLGSADVVYHLAGVNRPREERAFAEVNTGLTLDIIALIERMKRTPAVVFASSQQAVLDNPYGKSKKAAEDALIAFGEASGAPVHIYRLPGIFGKWSRPHYNSVVATFCHNAARGLDIVISCREQAITLVYIDDVVREFARTVQEPLRQPGGWYREIPRTFRTTLGDLADRIAALKNMRDTLVVPDLTDDFMRFLLATYSSFLAEDDLSRPLTVRRDERGSLFELIKSRHFGQIFVSRTNKGIVRGNHYHDSKVEKFCLVRGKAVVRFRHVLSDKVVSYPVSDERIEVVDVPPGYAHSIENTADDEMIVLFWANQPFDREDPDTHFLEVET